MTNGEWRMANDKRGKLRGGILGNDTPEMTTVELFS